MNAELVLPLSSLDRGHLSLAGGKAANLGELVRAGFPVPPGFCVTTRAYALAAAGSALASVLEALAGTKAGEPTGLGELAARARRALLEAPIPPEVERACAEAYRALGERAPVAVRSSATAEDLPEASFAGQQDTFLNVVGEAAVLDALRRCWASLFTERAVAYRASHGIDSRAVQLAVVVQRLVPAAVAGVLFTANPVTGRRRRAVIDASPGLGEAVVSGAVNPDHFEVDAGTGEILERRLGDKRVAIEPVAEGGTRRIERGGGAGQACLSDAELMALARLGAKVEAHYGAPQDLEWALDAERTLWLLQARPITTLFPLPKEAPASEDELRVYFSFNVAQGVFRPLTPMGFQGLRLLMSGAVASVTGFSPREPMKGPGGLAVAAERLFVDITGVLRSRLGRRVAALATGVAEARSAGLIQALLRDPRLAVGHTRELRSVALVLRILWRTRLPLRIARTLRDPAAARARLEARGAEALAEGDVPAGATAAERLDAVERLLFRGARHLLITAVSTFAPGVFCIGLARRLMGDLATREELDTVLRGLPHNPTTQMDLALWHLAARLRRDPASARTLASTPTTELVRRYHRGELPAELQQGLTGFLDRYGFRGVAEIDLGMERWENNPEHLLGSLANYLSLPEDGRAPDVKFREGAQQAEAMVAELSRRASARGWLLGRLVRFCLSRARELAGVREAPKFNMVRMLGRARRILVGVGEELARAGRFDSADDILFLSLPEARAAVAGEDVRALVRDRRAVYARELKRQHLPRLLLSDGTEPTAAASPANIRELTGAPASAGIITGKARVILEPNGARLEPGEILVAPSTDPGWTPLFLTAGGLVMEMGGAMSHGAVVAREYGIPAVVGVPHATERIVTGQLITVDGAAGTVALPEETGPGDALPSPAA